MAFASQALVQFRWGVPLTPVSVPACQDGFLLNKVSNGADVAALPRGSRTGITCASMVPSTSESSFCSQKQRVSLTGQRRGPELQQRKTVSKTSAAVREAAIDTEAAAAALEVAFLEPSFGLDDLLAMSGELEVVGPPPDWKLEAGLAAESSGRVSVLSEAPGVEELESVRRGLDDVFEMSGDLDILGPSPDDTSGFAAIGQEQHLVWPQIAEGVVRRAEGFLDLSSEQSQATSLEFAEGTERRQLGVGETSLGSRDSRVSRNPRQSVKRKLSAKAMSAHPVNSTIKVRAKRGDKKVVRRKSSQAAVLKPSRGSGSDGLVNAPALREIYREGVLNIGSRTGKTVPVQKDGLGFIHQWNLLTAEEEKKLAMVIQRSKALRGIKAELEASTGSSITEEQWADGAGISVAALERQVAAGNHAVQRLVECNLRLVMFVAHSMKNTPNALPLEDLFLAGIQGLLAAADRFDPAFGYRFSSYVVRAIRSNVRRAIMKSGALISLPERRTAALLDLDKIRRELSVKLGRLPTPEEIAAHKNVSVQVVHDVLRWNRGMDVTFHDFSDGWDEKFSVQVAGSDGGAFAKDEEFLKSDLEQCISTLPEKEGEVLRRRYGLGGRPSMSLREIGDALGMSYEMVRRYEARAMLLMRKAQRMERLMQYRPMLGAA